MNVTLNRFFSLAQILALISEVYTWDSNVNWPKWQAGGEGETSAIIVKEIKLHHICASYIFSTQCHILILMHKYATMYE